MKKKKEKVGQTISYCPVCSERKNYSARVCRTCYVKQAKGKFSKAEYKRKQYYIHREDILAKRKLARAESSKELRIDVLTYYGNDELACVLCGYTDIRALTIDHIDGKKNYEGGARQGGKGLYQWLRAHSYPPGFQTLCMNCNWTKG